MSEQKAEKPKAAEAVDLAATPSPLIFISHDSRDAELAESFSKLLSSVSCGVLKSFRSSDRKGSQGIEYGVEWYPELMGKLNAASDVVCLLTQRSLERPWILYEAGVAKGKLNTPVYGVALGIPLTRANSGPFAQFQNCDDNEDSLTKLVMQLVRRIPNSEPDREAVAMQAKAFKVKAAEIVKAQPDSKKAAEKASMDDANVAKLFEEVKVMFQDLPGRLSENGERRRRFRRFHPMMFEEMMHMSGRMGDPIGLLMMLSVFKDDAPWLYELGRELYEAMKRGNGPEIDQALETFKRISDMTMRGPWADEFMSGSKDTYMMMRELPMMLHHYAQRFRHRAEKRSKREKGEAKPSPDGEAAA
jgi:hypothetical protein